jgi:hypothetical protein
MATTVATQRAEIVKRLNIGSTTLEPTTAMIDQWIRDGFREGFGVLQPPFKTSATITSDAAAVTADRVLYVLVDGLILIEGEEWQHGASGVRDIPRRYNAESATIYYTNVPDLTGATIESSCALGDDWLESYVAHYAEEEALVRLSQTAAGQQGTSGPTFRVINERRKILLASLQRQRDMWKSDMDERMRVRLSFGPHFRREHAWAGFRNKSHMGSTLTGTNS